MQTIPSERWEQDWAELSAEIQGHPARVEALEPDDDPRLLIADAPFGGLRLEGTGATMHVLALIGGQAIALAAGSLTLTTSPTAYSLTFQIADLPGTRITVARASRRQPGTHRPPRERAVG